MLHESKRKPAVNCPRLVSAPWKELALEDTHHTTHPPRQTPAGDRSGGCLWPPANKERVKGLSSNKTSHLCLSTGLKVRNPLTVLCLKSHSGSEGLLVQLPTGTGSVASTESWLWLAWECVEIPLISGQFDIPDLLFSLLSFSNI